MKRKVEDTFLLLPLKARSIILGGLLGDGSLRIPKGYKNPRYSFRHCSKQYQYFLWKRNNLREISSKKDITSRIDGFSKEVKYRYQSLASPSLLEIYKFCFSRTKTNKFQIRRRWLNLMNETSLLVWWLDDGSLVCNKTKGVICTDGFSYDQNLILSKYLKNVWKIENKVRRAGKYYRIWIDQQESLKTFLLKLVSKLETKSMIYKFLLRYKDPVLQQRWISELSSHSIFSIEEITDLFQRMI